MGKPQPKNCTKFKAGGKGSIVNINTLLHGVIWISMENCIYRINSLR